MPTFVEGWKRSQEWVADIRPRAGTWAESVAGRIHELGLQDGHIGMDGLARPLDPDGWVPYSVYSRTLELLPNAKVTSLVDMLEKLRAVKSAEELSVLAKAAALGDLMLQTCREMARPGVRESEVYARMLEVMLANGGEEPTLFLWCCDKYPFRMPTTRRMEAGDLIICEMHPKFGGYYTHVERTFSLGAPEPEQLCIHEKCLVVYRRVQELFGPGKKISECMEALREFVRAMNMGICEVGIHGPGLASLEYARYRLHGKNRDAEVIKATGDQFLPGMVFAFIVDLVEPAWRNGETGCVFGETITITETGNRRLHSFSTDFQVIGI